MGLTLLKYLGRNREHLGQQLGGPFADGALSAENLINGSAGPEHIAERDGLEIMGSQQFTEPIRGRTLLFEMLALIRGYQNRQQGEVFN